MSDVPHEAKTPGAEPWVETEESLEARRRTSSFANRYHVIVTGGVARITIGEVVQFGETNWHTSFTMTAYDAVQLARFITSQDDYDRRQMGITQPPTEPAQRLNTGDG
jgi:hypothetical protein